MAQTGFPLFMDANSLTVLNDSGTTAITAGDIVYSAANDDKFGTTYATARSSYAAGDVKVKSMLWSTSGYKTVVGVALTDIAADGYGTIALEGAFLHRAEGNLEAGDPIRGCSTTANRVELCPIDVGTTSTGLANRYKIGKALTGGSAAKKIVLWKLSL